MLATKLKGATAAGGANKFLAVTHNTSPFISVYVWGGSGFGKKMSDPSTLPNGGPSGVAFSPSGDAIALAIAVSPYVMAYSWSSDGFGAKYSDPSTLPPAACRGVAFSPAGDAIVVVHQQAPYVTAYPWNSATGLGAKYSDPSTIPTGTNGQGVAFSPSGSVIAISTASTSSAPISAYKWSAAGFGTKYTDSAYLGRILNDVQFSPDGKFIATAPEGLAAGHVLRVLPWNDTTGFGTQLTNPSSMPSGQSHSVAFSPSGDSIVAGYSSSPYTCAYPFNNGSFGTKYSDPSTPLPGMVTNVKFPSDGGSVAMAHVGSPFVSAYPWSGSGFGAKYSNPSTLPAGAGLGVAFGEITV